MSETVSEGWNLIVGFDRKKVIDAIKEWNGPNTRTSIVLDNAEKKNIFGIVLASEMISKYLVGKLWPVLAHYGISFIPEFFFCSR
ncbi:MAG: hypothetical protein WA941_18910 [Nitrososphaeraceae archaeon]